MLKHLLILFVTLMLTSCATRSKYFVVYDTYLKGSQPKSLTFQDDKFLFEFLPVPNGVYFNIKNLTSSPAVIIWDRSYYIEPNNNSSKLLNMDIFQEERETLLKTKYESILPPGANFNRFTTSALNVDKFQNIDKSIISANMTMGNYNISMTSADWKYSEFFTYGRYWSDIGNILQSELPQKLEDVKDYILNNNNMGIGMAIQINHEIVDYRFDFKFKNVSVYRIKKYTIKKYDRAVWKEKLIHEVSMDETNGWQWEYIQNK